MRKITEAIIHCTATRPEWMSGNTPDEKVAEITRWHTKERGWSDIGYHFVIDRDGTVVKGRPMSRNGAHVRGHNKGTIGVSLVGGFGGTENDKFEDNFTPAQSQALTDLLEQLKAEYGFTKITGHNQYAAKACPTFDVPTWCKKGPKVSGARASVASTTTVKATLVAAGSTAGTAGAVLSQLDPVTQYIVVGLAGVGALALLWILKERIRKFASGDR